MPTKRAGRPRSERDRGIRKFRDRGGAARASERRGRPPGEHSHVDATVRERIAEVVLEIENEPLEEAARRIVERLRPEELAQLVADWLDAQAAI
jgi:hypothetical protein